MKENYEFNVALHRVGGNRYNHGFYRFGPLEQSGRGSIVKYEDAAKAYKELLDAHQIINQRVTSRIETLNRDVAEEREAVHEWKDAYTTLNRTLTKKLQHRSWTAFALSFYVLADAAIHLFVGG